MNLVERLIRADAKKADEMKIGVFRSRRLAAILEVEQPKIDVKIREIEARRANDIVGYQIDKNGKFDIAKAYDAKLMTCVEGVVDPNLRDKELQAHFKAKNAKDLCEKLFGFEVNALSDAIATLTGIEDDSEGEIKN